MQTTVFNQTTRVLATGLLFGAVVIGAISASGQTAVPGQLGLTPAQQAAYTLATGLSHYEQQLVAIAVAKLGPQRANAVFTQLAQVNSAMPGSLALVGQRII